MYNPCVNGVLLHSCSKTDCKASSLVYGQVVGPKLLMSPFPPRLFCRYLLEFTSEALAEYPGLGLEVFGMPSQAWITVRLNTCCAGPSLMSLSIFPS